MAVDSELMKNESTDQVSACPLSSARSYQPEALEKAIKHNTIVFLETDYGKTLIAIMLLHSYTSKFRKPSPCLSVFLVSKVVFVDKQAKTLKMHTDLQVGEYWEEKGVDFWDASIWKQEVKKCSYDDPCHFV